MLRVRGLRFTRCASLVAAVRLLGVAAGPSLQAAPGAVVGYDFHAIRASAGGLRTVFEVRDFLPVNPLLDVASPDTRSVVDGDRQFASASMPHPGDAVISVPGTAAGLTGVSDVPGYPLYVSAQHPVTPAAEQGAEGTGLLAEASADRASARAATINVIGPETDAGIIFDIGATRSVVESAREGPAKYRAVARSELDDIDILGGQIHIDSIVSSVGGLVDGDSFVADTPQIDVAGVSVAGVPVQITQEGISAGATTAAINPVTTALNEALAQQGMTLRLTEGSTNVEGGRVVATGGAVLITMAGDFQGYPSELKYQLGHATIEVVASGSRTSSKSSGPSSTSTPVSVVREETAVLGAAADADDFDPGTLSAGGAGFGESGLGAKADSTSVGSRSTDEAFAPLAGQPVSDVVDLTNAYRFLVGAGLAVVIVRALLRGSVRRRAAMADLRAFWRW